MLVLSKIKSTVSVTLLAKIEICIKAALTFTCCQRPGISAVTRNYKMAERLELINVFTLLIVNHLEVQSLPKT